MRAEIDKLRTERASLQSQIEATRAELAFKYDETENIRKEYVNVLYSRSYRLTAPLRSFLVLYQNIKLHIHGLFFRSSIEEPPSTLTPQPLVIIS